MPPQPCFLLIETATDVCSVGISSGDKLLALREETGRAIHSKMLSVFIDEVLNEAQIQMNELAAVVLSKGPGSYTGLRIGSATAKGICYGLDLPLIAINSLAALAQQVELEADQLKCPMIDARRMEVYCALFDAQNKSISETEAKIIDESSFSELLNRHEVFFFGEGMNKCREVINHKNASFLADINCSVKGLIKPALNKYEKQDFEKADYFEPYYLKNFVVHKSRKLKNFLGQNDKK